MIEVPLWIFVLICIATYINFLQLISLASKLKKNNVQDIINGQIVSKVEAIHEYRESKK